MRAYASVNGSSGQTLIEVLVAVVVLAILVTGITGVAVLTTRLSLQSERHTVALGVVNEELEFVRSLDYTDIGFTAPTGDDPAGVLSYTDTITKGELTYTVNRIVEFYDDPVTGGSDTDIKKVQVDATWTGPSGDTYEATAVTYVSELPDFELPSASPLPSISPSVSPSASPSASPSPSISPSVTPSPSVSATPSVSPSPSALPSTSPSPSPSPECFEHNDCVGLELCVLGQCKFPELCGYNSFDCNPDTYCYQPVGSPYSITVGRCREKACSNPHGCPLNRTCVSGKCQLPALECINDYNCRSASCVGGVCGGASPNWPAPGGYCALVECSGDECSVASDCNSIISGCGNYSTLCDDGFNGTCGRFRRDCSCVARDMLYRCTNAGGSGSGGGGCINCPNPGVCGSHWYGAAKGCMESHVFEPFADCSYDPVTFACT